MRRAGLLVNAGAHGLFERQRRVAEKIAATKLCDCPAPCRPQPAVLKDFGNLIEVKKRHGNAVFELVLPRREAPMPDHPFIEL